MSTRTSYFLLTLSIIPLLVACSHAPSKEDIVQAFSSGLHHRLKAQGASDTMLAAMAPKVDVEKYSCKAAKVGYMCDVTIALKLSTGQETTKSGPMHIVKGPHGWRILN